MLMGMGNSNNCNLLHPSHPIIKWDFKEMEKSFGADMLLLSVSCAYVRRLLSNQTIELHLEKYHPDVLSTLRMLVNETASQEGLVMAS